MATARRQAAEVSIADVAKRALKDADGNIDQAAAAFERAVRASPKLRELLTEPLIAGACREAVKAQVRENRSAIWSDRPARQPPPRRPTDPGIQASRVVQLAAGTLLMFPLPGGKRLGEATRDEIGAAATFYESQAGDMATKARWLRLVAQSLTGDKTVSQALTDKRLRELQAEALKDAS